MRAFAAILLAAGLSRRMGARNKLLLDWHGRPPVRHVAETYLRALGSCVTVVTGHEAGGIRAALGGLDLRFHHNPAFEAGQQTSVAAGLAAGHRAEAVLVGLGDQPLLTAQDLATLMAAHRAADPGRISIPVDGARRGNPVVLPAALHSRLLADAARPGCRRFVRSDSDLVQRLPLPAPGFFADIDTPEAYDRHLLGVGR